MLETVIHARHLHPYIRPRLMVMNIHLCSNQEIILLLMSYSMALLQHTPERHPVPSTLKAGMEQGMESEVISTHIYAQSLGTHHTDHAIPLFLDPCHAVCWHIGVKELFCEGAPVGIDLATKELQNFPAFEDILRKEPRKTAFYWIYANDTTEEMPVYKFEK